MRYFALAYLHQASGKSSEALATLDVLVRVGELRDFAPDLIAQGTAVRAHIELIVV